MLFDKLLIVTCLSAVGWLSFVWWGSICTFYILLKANDSISVKVQHFLFYTYFCICEAGRNMGWMSLTLPCLVYLRHLMFIFSVSVILFLVCIGKWFEELPWYLKLSLVLTWNSPMINVCLSELARELEDHSRFPKLDVDFKLRSFAVSVSCMCTLQGMLRCLEWGRAFWNEKETLWVHRKSPCCGLFLFYQYRSEHGCVWTEVWWPEC